ncbi:hypothetical protein HYH02_013281 [Chlamydomonas schloesseri]|uniref:Guanylate cyclase domain-containing protein n=1 Tax=Chlamydomonas schloesseri TaxID=2026947 RepID=A0A835SR06_9CHLO|nr:hypothetical protein HYH02_013281 [Chlamydomonas schloesseri]|eukprot:KAG2431588.1 hypothetical protein HYH02_013281 [Chlamydomonas schloesseri]
MIAYSPTALFIVRDSVVMFPLCLAAAVLIAGTRTIPRSPFTPPAFGPNVNASAGVFQDIGKWPGGLYSYVTPGNASGVWAPEGVHYVDVCVDVPVQSDFNGAGGYAGCFQNVTRDCSSMATPECVQTLGAAGCFNRAVDLYRNPPPPPADPGKASVPLAAIVVPTVVVGSLLLLGLSGLTWWVLKSAGASPLRARLRCLRPPRAGAETTLVVTDIEGSTGAWEVLPSEVMNEALVMHHAAVRKLARKFYGYEFATPWPERLLQLVAQKPVWVRRQGIARADTALSKHASMKDAASFLVPMSASEVLLSGDSITYGGGFAGASPKSAGHGGSGAGSGVGGLVQAVRARLSLASASGMDDGLRQMHLRRRRASLLMVEAPNTDSIREHGGRAYAEQLRDLWHVAEDPTTGPTGAGTPIPGTPPPCTPAGGATPATTFSQFSHGGMDGSWGNNGGGNLPSGPGPGVFNTRSSPACALFNALPTVPITALLPPAALPTSSAPVFAASLLPSPTPLGPAAAPLAPSCLGSITPPPPPLPAVPERASSVKHLSITERGPSALLMAARRGAMAAENVSTRKALFLPAGAAEAAVCVFRGLRVRVGIAAGVAAEDVKANATSRKLEYGGKSLKAAKAVCDAAQGGMVLLTGETFRQMTAAEDDEPASTVVVLHMGDFWPGPQDESAWPAEALPLPLYSALLPPLAGRLPLLGPAAAGTLEAPVVGRVAVVFMHAVGHSVLKAWNAAVAGQALAIYGGLAKRLLRELGGYTVELSDGLCLATFSDCYSAAAFALRAKDGLLDADWPLELLEHELGEVVAVESNPATAAVARLVASRATLKEAAAIATTATGPGGSSNEPPGTTTTLLFRGLRMRAGIDVTSDVHIEISPVTGRMTYRGRVMNRAARISAKATSGAVMVSEEVWDEACRALEAPHGQIAARPAGSHELKGVGVMSLFSCHWNNWSITAINVKEA